MEAREIAMNVLLLPAFDIAIEYLEQQRDAITATLALKGNTPIPRRTEGLKFMMPVASYLTAPPEEAEAITTNGHDAVITGTGREVACQKCGRMFKSPSGLSSHMRSFHQKKTSKVLMSRRMTKARGKVTR